LKIGVRVPNDGPIVSRDNLKTLALTAEEVGYDSIFVHDHILVPDNTWSPFFDPLISLASIASLTERIRLGTSIYLLPLRNPLIAAKQFATLDQMSNGRLIVGVGVGYLQEEYTALHVPFNKRGSITDEYLVALKLLWTNSRASIKGKFVNFEDVDSSPKPVQKPYPPIWIGGASEAATIRALKYGDGRLTLGGPQGVSKEMKRLKTHAQALGRDVNRLTIVAEPWVSLDENIDDAVNRAFESPLIRQRFPNREDFARDSLVGSHDDVLKKLETFSNAGADYLELRFVTERVSFEATFKMMRQFAEWLPEFD